jgi:hypothetical protein
LSNNIHRQPLPPQRDDPTAVEVEFRSLISRALLFQTARELTKPWPQGQIGLRFFFKPPARLHCPLPNRVGVFAPVLPRLRTFRGDPGGIMILYCLLGTSSLNLEWKHNLMLLLGVHLSTRSVSSSYADSITKIFMIKTNKRRVIPSKQRRTKKRKKKKRKSKSREVQSRVDRQ